MEIMESRNTTLTTRGELHTHSPQDRKAVNTLDELLGQVEEKTSACFVTYPLTNLIPEIVADENMERSFKRVMSIEIHDFETGIDTKEGEDRYLVSFRNPANSEWGKFFTASLEMKGILDQISDIEDGFPFETIIKCEVFDGSKRKYNFT